MHQSVGIIISIIWLVMSVHCDQPLVRQTANGPVEGIEQTSSLGQKYYSFKGIPFAEPPITGIDPYTGKQVDRRFKAPIPLKHTWSDNLNATKFGYFCTQTAGGNSMFSAKLSETDENCLFLNVFEPADGAKNKTVLVYIYGGAFSVGDPDEIVYGPDFLLSEDNILVTIQYRVGIFGFLNLGLDEYSGNMGLKDQQLAIKWVFDNIEHFSGNKSEILLFGQSAGGASVGYQLLNQESRKYFSRAFLASSSALSSYALTKANHLQRLKRFSQIDDKDQLIAYLRTAERVNLSRCAEIESLDAPWVPTIEHPNAVNPFITKSPIDIYNSDDAPVMDVMYSFTSKEGTFFRPHLLNRTDPMIEEKWEGSAFKHDLELQFEGFNESAHEELYKKSVVKLNEAYYKDISNHNAVRSANLNLMSEMYFADSIIKATVLQTVVNHKSNNSGDHKNTFLYRFSVDAGLNAIKILMKIPYEEATHADDLCYIFHCHALDQFHLYDNHLEKKDATYDQIMRMVKIITNFAKTGNPSLANDTPFKNCESPNEIFCQEISNDLKSSVTTNIKEILHYDTWREVEEIYTN